MPLFHPRTPQQLNLNQREPWTGAVALTSAPPKPSVALHSLRRRRRRHYPHPHSKHQWGHSTRPVFLSARRRSEYCSETVGGARGGGGGGARRPAGAWRGALARRPPPQREPLRAPTPWRASGSAPCRSDPLRWLDWSIGRMPPAHGPTDQMRGPNKKSVVAGFFS